MLCGPQDAKFTTQDAKSQNAPGQAFAFCETQDAKFQITRGRFSHFFKTQDAKFWLRRHISGTGHKILAHRSIRYLLTGSLHEVWEDYRFVTAPDTYCEDCKIAASKVNPLSKTKK